MGDKIAKWAAGPHCTCVACFLSRTFLQLLYGTTDGPVLSQTDLYLLQTELLINPVLAGQSQFNLLFNLLTGGFHVFLAIVGFYTPTISSLFSSNFLLLIADTNFIAIVLS